MPHILYEILKNNKSQAYIHETAATLKFTNQKINKELFFWWPSRNKSVIAQIMTQMANIRTAIFIYCPLLLE